MEVILQGKIEYKDCANYSSFEKLFLIDDNGYKIDLVNRFQEYMENYGTKFSVRYYVCPEQVTLDQATERFLNRLHGVVSADYEVDNYYYSEYTHGTDYDTHLKIGGHDLFSELRGSEGQYLILIMTIEK